MALTLFMAMSLGSGSRRGDPPVPAAPVISAVTIDNMSPAVGEVLTATVSYSVKGRPTPTMAYQWYADMDEVGTDSPTYQVQEADEGKAITCKVTATNSEGSDEATSDPTDDVTQTQAPVVSSVTIDNTSPKVGDTLTATVNYSTPGKPSPTVTFQWYADAGEVGTNSATYAVPEGDLGKAITVFADATNSEGSDSATSDPTDPVEAAGPDLNLTSKLGDVLTDKASEPLTSKAA
jgi:hypothetical protein